MASDIPVFREIGADYVAYFDLATPETLARLVEQHQSNGQFPAVKPLSDWQWIGWREASNQLLEKALRIAKPQVNNDEQAKDYRA